MGLLEVFRGGEGSTGDTIYECRNCGTTLSPDSDACPACESSEIAAYTL